MSCKRNSGPSVSTTTKSSMRVCSWLLACQPLISWRPTICSPSSQRPRTIKSWRTNASRISRARARIFGYAQVALHGWAVEAHIVPSHFENVAIARYANFALYPFSWSRHALQRRLYHRKAKAQAKGHKDGKALLKWLRLHMARARTGCLRFIYALHHVARALVRSFLQSSIDSFIHTIIPSFVLATR